MQLLDSLQTSENFSAPFVVPNAKRENKTSASELKEAFAVAMSHPLPLTTDFEKGFNGLLSNLTPCQIVSLLFSDITVFRYALKGLGDARNEEEKDFIVKTAWRGYMQSVYASWLAFSCNIRLHISESETGMTRLSLTTDPNQAGYECACMEIANIGDFFTDTLTKYGAVVDPVLSMGTTINNALQTLAIIEQSCFFSYTHCSNSDTQETREYFLSMAKAAYLVRSTAMNWMLKGVKGFKKTKPLNKNMSVNLKTLDKKALHNLQNDILESLWLLSLGLMMFQYLTNAQMLFSQNADTRSET